MKNLKLSYLRNFALGLLLTCVTVSTVWSTTIKDSEFNEEQSSSLAPRSCVYFYHEDMDDDPYNYVWDCIGCVKVYNMVPDGGAQAFGCSDSI